MLPRQLTILQLLLLSLLLPAAARADTRTIEWSGHTWDVRPPGFGAPGPNHWSDSEANVQVDGSDLVLSIVKDSDGRWTSSEVSNQRSLGYGTYRWVVKSDLGALDSHEVLGMFTYGGSSPSHNEIDIEPSHWGRPEWPSGSATVWQDPLAGLNQVKTFRYTGRPPYVNQFTWTPGRISYVITEAGGATLLDWTVTSGVPTPSSEVPMINYWRFQGEPPAEVRSMRIASFTWLPPDEPPAPGAGSGAAPCPPGVAALSGLRMRPARFAVTGGGRGTTVRWKATVRGSVRMVVKRAVGDDRFRRVGTLRRSVREGTGRVRIARKVGGRSLRAGRHRLVVSLATARGERVPCARRTLDFTVLGR